MRNKTILLNIDSFQGNAPVKPILQNPSERFSLAQNNIMKKRSNQEQQEKMFSLIKSCKESGMSNKDFCQQKGIGQAMFYYWQKKLIEYESGEQESFFPVQVKKDKIQSDPMEIIYPNGVKIKVSPTTELSIVRTLVGLA